MKNLIGISGKISSGKDTVGTIIQYLIYISKIKNYPVYKSNKRPVFSDIQNWSASEREQHSGWKIKKFADKLKDCACLLIGCTREQLEDPEFKNKPLGPEWNRYYLARKGSTIPYSGIETKDYQERRAKAFKGSMDVVEQKMTPRLLLQLLGTDAGRNIIHPNIWVNASFAEYIAPYVNGMTDEPIGYPNWIFTDMRFPNELDAIKQRGGITIRVNRPYRPYDSEQPLTKGIQRTTEHESETALDNSNFDYVIDNNGSLSNLIGKVQAILEMEKII